MEFIANNVYVIPVILCLLLILVITLLPSSDNFKKRARSRRVHSISISNITKMISSSKNLSTIYSKLYSKLTVVAGSEASAHKLTIIAMGSYILAAVFILLLTFGYVAVWYIALLNLFIALFVPFMGIRLVITMVLNRAIRQLPEAIDELESCFYRTNRLKPAIDLAYPNMPRRISKAFEILAYNMTRNERQAIENFKESFKNSYIDSLAALFEVYISGSGGDIGPQLQYLNVLIHKDLMYSKQTSGKLLKYKVMAFVTLLLVPILTKINTSILPTMTTYYSATAKGSSQLSLTILVAVAYFGFVEVIEKV